MSTSHIPVYYDNHLIGSMTLAEFMTQPRYDGRSVMELMSLPKKELHYIYLGINKLADTHHPKCSGYNKSDFLFGILMTFWHKQGMVAWELDALHEVNRVYLKV